MQIPILMKATQKRDTWSVWSLNMTLEFMVKPIKIIITILYNDYKHLTSLVARLSNNSFYFSKSYRTGKTP